MSPPRTLASNTKSSLKKKSRRKSKEERKREEAEKKDEIKRLLEESGTESSWIMKYLFEEETDKTNSSLILHYAFDEGTGSAIADSSGNGNSGSFESIPVWESGVSGSAISLDGVASYISAPATVWSAVDTQFTVSFWAKGAEDLGNNWGFFAGDGGDRIVYCHMPWGGQVIFDTTLDWGSERVIVPAAGDELRDQWRHWTFVRNTETGEKKLYMDGILYGSTTPSDVPISGVVDFFIGVGNAGAAPYKGLIDDFKIHDRALSAEEILWEAGVTTPIDKPF